MLGDSVPQDFEGEVRLLIVEFGSDGLVEVVLDECRKVLEREVYEDLAFHGFVEDPRRTQNSPLTLCPSCSACQPGLVQEVHDEVRLAVVVGPTEPSVPHLPHSVLDGFGVIELADSSRKIGLDRYIERVDKRLFGGEVVEQGAIGDARRRGDPRRRNTHPFFKEYRQRSREDFLGLVLDRTIHQITLPTL